MARQIKALIELTASQTEEFITSLNKVDEKSEKSRKKAIEEAKHTKFNIIL